VPLAWEEFETVAVDDWEARKGFLCFTKEEEVALTTLQPIMAQHIDELVGAFYRHLLSFHETRIFLTDELISARLLEAQNQRVPNMPNTYNAQVRNAGGARSLNGP
jgi:hypothetical protein